MAGTSAANVAVGKPNLELSGGILAAPVGTERPTSYKGPYDPAYVSLGYVSEDGVTETSEDSTESIKVWGGIKVRSVKTESGTNLSFTLVESRRAETLKYVFGPDNVTVANGEVTVRRNNKDLPHMQLIVDLMDGDDSSHLDAGYAQVVERGDITYVDGETIAYELTVSCDPDENGDTLLERKAADADDADDEGEGDDSGE